MEVGANDGVGDGDLCLLVGMKAGGAMVSSLFSDLMTEAGVGLCVAAVSSRWLARKRSVRMVRLPWLEGSARSSGNRVLAHGGRLASSFTRQRRPR